MTGLLAESAVGALLLSIAIALPVVLVAALVGSVVAALQAATQIQDPTLAHLPRLLAVGATLAVAGGWMARELAAFAVRMFQLAAV